MLGIDSRRLLAFLWVLGGVVTLTAVSVSCFWRVNVRSRGGGSGQSLLRPELLKWFDEMYWSQREPSNATYPDFPIRLLPTTKVCSSNPYMLAAVVTVPREFRERKRIREILASLTAGEVVPIFPLGRSIGVNDEETAGLLTEQWDFGDLLVGDFPETYEMLPVKTVMAFNFFARLPHCAQWLLKVDHDSIVNWPYFLSHLRSQETFKDFEGKTLNAKTDPLWMGFVWHGMPIIHNPRHKNFEPLYSHQDTFPTYTSGQCQLFNRPMLQALTQRRRQVRHYFVNEDAMIGILMNGTGILPVPEPRMIPFGDAGWLAFTCGKKHSLSIQDCPCDQWFSVHAGSSTNAHYVDALKAQTNCATTFANTFSTTTFATTFPPDTAAAPTSTSDPGPAPAVSVTTAHKVLLSQSR